jgi:hypothetical protein
MSTIWILSSKNNTGETKLTNNYQAEQIIRHDKTKSRAKAGFKKSPSG